MGQALAGAFLKAGHPPPSGTVPPARATNWSHGARQGPASAREAVRGRRAGRHLRGRLQRGRAPILDSVAEELPRPGAGQPHLGHAGALAQGGAWAQEHGHRLSRRLDHGAGRARSAQPDALLFYCGSAERVRAARGGLEGARRQGRASSARIQGCRRSTIWRCSTTSTARISGPGARVRAGRGRRGAGGRSRPAIWSTITGFCRPWPPSARSANIDAGSHPGDDGQPRHDGGRRRATSWSGQSTAVSTCAPWRPIKGVYDKAVARGHAADSWTSTIEVVRAG